MAKISFITDDGVTVTGEWQKGTLGGPAALFLHMMPATKESWAPLANALAARGFATLAIDLRGHGESIVGAEGRALNYNVFSEEEHQSTSHDVEAALRWLADRGVAHGRIVLVGASIGANLSILHASRHPQIPATVALSPGLDYHGVKTEVAAAALPRSQKLLLIASKEDAYSFESVDALAMMKEDAEVQRQHDAGHGTTMLEKVPGLLEYVTEWTVHNVG